MENKSESKEEFVVEDEKGSKLKNRNEQRAESKEQRAKSNEVQRRKH